MLHHAARTAEDEHVDAELDQHGAVRAAERIAGLWRRVRWGAALFCLVQFAAYVPGPGVRVPYPLLALGGALAGVAGVVNLVAVRVERRHPRRAGLDGVARRDLLLLATDTAVVAFVVLVFAFEPTSAVWVLLVVPVLEAGLIGRLRCALAAWAAAVGALLLREVLAVQLHHLPVPSPAELLSTLGFRTGVLLLAATAVGVQASVAAQHLRLLHAAQQRLAHDAGHDPLTGLATRRLFLERAGAALRDQRHRDGALAVLFVDCDSFKAVNDTHGHAAGDAVLLQVADRLRALVGEAGVAARLGGDEFAALLHVPVLSGPAHRDPADHLLAAVRGALAAPYALGEPTARDAQDAVAMSCSVGAAVRCDGDTLPGLLRRADEAMYADKAGHTVGAGR